MERCTHPRSVKRKLDPSTNGGCGGNPQNLADDVAARVGAGDEVSALRETLVRQQQTIQDLSLELDEERNAASTAANEAMAMILRLQKEKAEIQMEFRQFKRFAEEKMAHDHQELVALDDLLFKREQKFESLCCEIKGYKNVKLKDLDYPSLKCMVLGDDYEESVIEDYSPTTLKSRICELEKKTMIGPEEEKFLGGGDHRLEVTVVGPNLGIVRNLEEEFDEEGGDRHLEKETVVEPDSGIVRDLEEEFEEVEGGDNRSDGEESARVYTIDAIHDVGISREKGDEDKMEDIKKLCARLQALEADRESMRQVIISTRTEKAQLVLLKEIAQQMCKEAVPVRRTVVRKPSLIANFSFSALIKLVLAFIFWRKKASRSKYSFGLSKNNVGLLLLLDKSPRVNQRRCHNGTQG